MRSNIGDIRDPNRIGRAYVKVLLQLISRYDSRLGPILTRTAFIADLRTQSFITHELGDSVRSTVLTQTQQIMMDLAIAIDTAALQS